MKKILITIAFVITVLAPGFFCQAANLTNAFGDEFLGKVGGANGAGYNTSQRSIDPIIGNIILIITSFLGVLFLALMIFGGFTWMTAMGDEKKVTKAQQMLTGAIIGLIVVAAAYMITYFVFIKVVSQTLAV